MNWHNFHFIRPLWWLALIPLIILVYGFYNSRNLNHAWSKVIDSHLLNYLIKQKSKPSYISTLVLIFTGILIIFALSGPTWHRSQQPTYQADTARVLVLDMSRSMNAQDIKPSRLVRARYKIRDILAAIKDGQVGMVAFTREPYVVSPLTHDSATIAAMVPSLTTDIMPVSGHNIARALQKAAQLIHQAGNTKGKIILVTDNQANKASLTMANELAQQGIDTSVLAVGTQRGAPIPLAAGGFVKNSHGRVLISKLPENSLKKLALTGNGVYQPFSKDNNNDINNILAATANHSPAKASKNQQKSLLWQDDGRYFILPFLIILMLCFRRGWLEEVVP